MVQVGLGWEIRNCTASAAKVAHAKDIALPDIPDTKRHEAKAAWRDIEPALLNAFLSW